jgi:hypothetical protein
MTTAPHGPSFYGSSHHFNYHSTVRLQMLVGNLFHNEGLAQQKYYVSAYEALLYLYVRVQYCV